MEQGKRKMLSLPDINTVKGGRFLGYTIEGFWEVFRVKKINYMIVDGIKNGKYYKYIDVYKGKIGKLANGFDMFTGLPR